MRVNETKEYHELKDLGIRAYEIALSSKDIKSKLIAHTLADWCLISIKEMSDSYVPNFIEKLYNKIRFFILFCLIERTKK